MSLRCWYSCWLSRPPLVTAGANLIADILLVTGAIAPHTG